MEYEDLETKTIDEVKQILIDKDNAINNLKSKEESIKDLRLKFETEEKKRKELEDSLKKKEQEVKEVEQKKEEEKLIDIQNKFRLSAINDFSKDEEEKKKIEYFFNKLSFSATTEEEIKDKVKKAYVLAKHDTTTINNAFVSSGNAPENKSNSFSDTQEGQALAKALGLGFIKAKK